MQHRHACILGIQRALCFTNFAVIADHNRGKVIIVGSRTTYGVDMPSGQEQDLATPFPAQCPECRLYRSLSHLNSHSRVASYRLVVCTVPFLADDWQSCLVAEPLFTPCRFRVAVPQGIRMSQQECPIRSNTAMCCRRKATIEEVGSDSQPASAIYTCVYLSLVVTWSLLHLHYSSHGYIAGATSLVAA